MCMATAALGQAEGEVELIGFGGWYRPNCWVPMKLRLRPTVGEAETYRIQVIQEDMDRDRVSYSRPFTLNGNRPGERHEEQVWVYFRPQPRDLDRAQGPADLASLIRVFLCKGEKQIVQIKFSAGTALRNLDGMMPSGRGSRLVVGLTTSGSQPNLAAYYDAYAMMEDVVYVAVTQNDLPTNPLGFDAVDDFIWDHPDPGLVNPDAIGAIDEWVKSGGRMVVCQSVEWQKTRDGPLAAMLPVVATGMAEEKNAGSLRKLAGVPDLDRKELSQDRDLPNDMDPWPDLRGRSIPICRAAVRPGARVEEWSLGEANSPYLARWMYGQGLVTWVAQDLGSPAISPSTVRQGRLDKADLRLYGWGRIWDKVLGLPNNTTMHPDVAKTQGFPSDFVDACRKTQANYAKGPNYSTPDPSRSFLSSTEIPGRAAALVGLALLFFAAYWLVACLGSYFFLLGRKKTHQSWFMFAACAVGATGVTGLFVRLVLRGPPEMAHVSFVRWSGTADSRVVSQVGLLVKQDARLKIELKDTATGLVSTVTPLPIHTRYSPEGSEFLGYLEYDVPVPERSTGTPGAITVPFRSTLKKFQLDWTGTKITGIEGNASWGKNGLTGKLTNLTGHDLYQVYIAFNTGGVKDDTLLRLRGSEGKPVWAKGDQLDLAKVSDKDTRKTIGGSAAPTAMCDYGLLNGMWMPSFDDTLRRADSGGFMGNNRELPFLLLSLFDRIQPRPKGTDKEASYVIHRWSARHLDASAAILAGNMVILARGDDPSADISPLPVTLEVDGRKMAGTGAVYYQFVIPLERPSESTPTTQPVEK
ncbi:MAG: hypothetical protein ACHRHE_08010 [Tepidisphaerales bacterium]